MEARTGPAVAFLSHRSPADRLLSHSSKSRRARSHTVARMTERDVIVVPPAGGRRYELEAMRSRFLADGQETGDRYCVSEWWLESGEPGPGAHSHEANEELFYVLEGTMTFLAGDDVVDAPKGTFLRIPAGVVHDFKNRGDTRAGALNVFIPGGFERLIGQWTA
jgi:mannose-6-phosphate isomerase-like protein (cupin superfamily)